LDDELINKAAEMLLKNQDAKGCWKRWSIENIPAIDTTAMAIHALVGL